MNTKFLLFLIGMNLVAAGSWWMRRSRFVFPLSDWRGLAADIVAVTALMAGLSAATWVAFKR